MVSGDNIAALTAASHFSLGGHGFFLCVKAWILLEDVSTAREWAAVFQGRAAVFLCWVFQSVFLVTSSEILHYGCDGLQCRCTTCISQDVLKNCRSHRSSCLAVGEPGEMWEFISKAPVVTVLEKKLPGALLMVLILIQWEVVLAFVSVRTWAFFSLLLVSLCMSLNLNH